MHINLSKILKLVLIFWSVYAFFEASLYISNIRLMDVSIVWSSQALTYAKLMGPILGSTFLLISIVAFKASKNLEKYKDFIKISGIWAIFHGGLLIYLALIQDNAGIFSPNPSLFAWIPFYNQYLVLEGVMLFLYSLLIFLWVKKNA